MWYLNGLPLLNGGITWQAGLGSTFRADDPEGLRLAFHFSSFSRAMQRREALKALERVVANNSLDWIKPGRKTWTLDLQALKQKFGPKAKAATGDLSKLEWLEGVIEIEPEFETKSDPPLTPSKYSPTHHTTTIAFYIDPKHIDEMRRGAAMGEPVVIKESIERFRADHPDPSAVGFLMMKFGKTVAHDKFVTAIRSAFKAHGITVLRADDKEYHDDLFPNILTYIHGCGIGVAVFERIEANEFNPNVSLEVGYMLSMGKPLCLLKDQTLTTLPTDLVGKLYKPFDVLDAENTIGPQIDKWVGDKGLSKKP